MDDFSDDGFDDLNDNALQELENNALQFTQAQKPTQSQPPSRLLGYGFEDDDYDDDTVVIDDLAQLPVRHPNDARHLPPQQPQVQQRWNQAGPSGSPFAANAGYPTPSHAVQHGRVPSYPSQHPVPPPGLPGRHAPLPTSSQYMRPPPPPAVPLAHRSGFPQSQAPSQLQSRQFAQTQNDLVATLQARVLALETELTSTKGEVAIVRSKYDKSVATHDQMVARLKKQNAEALSKQERLVEAALTAERTAAMELQFTRQDLKEELDKSKKGRKGNNGATTPKKSKGAGWGNLADGFDDVEILPSPSKGQAGPRSRGKSVTVGAIAPPIAERTPTKGKRKRPVFDSPAMALEVLEDDVEMADSGSPSGGQAAAVSRLPRDGLPFDFLKLMLDHRGFQGQPLTFDLLARYAFPSDPHQSIASVIFQKLHFLGSPDDPMRLMVDFCELLLDIWSRCLREKYHAPIFDLVSLVSFILQLNTTSIAPHIISALVPVAQTTVYLLAIPRFTSPDGELSNDPDGTLRRLFLEIDTEGTLQTLYLAALGCLDPQPGDSASASAPSPDSESPQVQFWKLLLPDFVLVMLSPKQPQNDFLGVLSLLCTSCLPDSIGPITTEDPEKSPAAVARAIIDRVSHYVAEPPKWAAEPSSQRKREVVSTFFGHKQCIVRLSALRTLMAFAQSPFGALHLASSNVAIPRLVLVLCAAIDALYDIDLPTELPDPKQPQGKGDNEEMQTTTTEKALDDPQLTQTAGADASPGKPAQIPDKEPDPKRTSDDELKKDTTPLVLTIISSITLLLHALITDPATSAQANMPNRLASSHGGPQRYLLTLARLNFAEEDLVLESGIDADTVERAHELLELAVTPDEGEGVGEVFGF